MHTNQPRKPKNTITGTISILPPTGHKSQKRDFYQDRRTNRNRTRAAKNRTALTGW